MARRSGQITARGERKWIVRWYVGEDGGKRRYAAKTIHGTKHDAQKYLNSQLRSQDLGVYVEPTRLTLGEFLDRWLEDAVRSKVSARTHKLYSGLLGKHVRPVLAARRLDQITTLELQRLVNQMDERAERHLSARTHRLTHRVLSQALGQAVEWNLLPLNPARKIVLPKSDTREKRAFSADEVRRFREKAKATKHAALWDFLLATGCRPGEALGLSWGDLDLQAGLVHIRRALTKDAEGKPILGPPKTKKSVRTIPLPAPALAVLAQHKSRQAEHKLKLGEHYARGLDLVFANEAGRPLNEANLRVRVYKPLCEAAEIEGAFGPYDLRHTVATQLLSLGENPKVVSERLGHSSTQMTLDVYGHVLPGMQKMATEKLERALFSDS